MKSSIEISAQFDFRGETFTPVITLDLDRLMQSGAVMPDYYQLLANENGIGLYSYEFEVLESSELRFSDAQGLAADFVENGNFDFEGFRRRWLEQRELETLTAIAQRHLGVDELAQQPSLREALLEAYRLGKASRG